MNRYVIDTYAWIEYLDGTGAGLKVRKILLEDSEVYTHLVSIAEVICRTKRSGKDVDVAYNSILRNSIIINGNEELSKEVGILHAEIKKKIKDFGLADAFVSATARKLNAKILTGDPHFKKFKEAILIK
ncbi:MAG: PIN domain-containing protein [Nanoarchaeota archaeon]